MSERLFFVAFVVAWVAFMGLVFWLVVRSKGR